MVAVAVTVTSVWLVGRVGGAAVPVAVAVAVGNELLPACSQIPCVPQDSPASQHFPPQGDSPIVTSQPPSPVGPAFWLLPVDVIVTRSVCVYVVVKYSHLPPPEPEARQAASLFSVV